jgi:hypothetical protein
LHALAKQQAINASPEQTPIVVFYLNQKVAVMDNDKLSTSKNIGSATAFNRRLRDIVFTFHKAGDYFIDDQTGSTWDITRYCREGAQ